jgi:hypothetical protein
MPISLADLNWMGLAIATAAGFLLGGLWYSPRLFGGAWRRELGWEGSGPGEASAKPSGSLLVSAFLIELLSAVLIAFVLVAIGEVGWRPGLFWGGLLGLLAGLGLGLNYLFERKSLKLFFINAGFQLVSRLVMGAILGLFVE